MEQNIRNSLESRNSRVQAVIEVCERQITSLYQPALTSLDKMTWDEIEHVKSYLPLLGSNAVDTLCQMLKSSRKQTAEAVTYALGRLGDERAARPLIAMMEEQSGQANALRARDALISLGQVAMAGLIEGSNSSKWEVRYHIVQALAILGSPITLGVIQNLAENDKSSKVREAATEACKFVTLLDANMQCTTIPNSFWFVHLDMPLGQAMDVINGKFHIKAWRFDKQELYDAEVTSPGFMITSALIVAYQAIRNVAKNYDLVVLMDEFDEESVIIGVIPLSNETDIDLFIDIVQEMLSVLVGVISRASLDTFWLATTNFNPVVRFTCETATIYQINGGIIPVRQSPLQKYGSNLLFQFRGGYIDRSWAYRENLQTLKDQGIIRHIPVVV